MPYTNTNANNVQLGTCSVTFGTTDLGLTKGGVEVQVQTQTYKITVDQFGSTEVNEYITGRTASVKVPMAETDLELLAAVIPNSTLVTDSVTPTKMKINVATATGTSLRSFAAKLVLHPIAQATSSKNFDFVLPITCPTGDFTFAYKLDAERVYEVTFYAYPDLTTGLLYVIGDESAA
jgi:hypothetical protein